MMLAASAIDLEHMILPNELTLGAAAICLLSSPLAQRAASAASSIGAIAVGFRARLRASSSSTKGSKARARNGPRRLSQARDRRGRLARLRRGAVFVLFAGALQQVLAAGIMRVFGWNYAVPASVRAELAELRAKAAAGDKDAADELADDPMASGQPEGRGRAGDAACRSDRSSGSRASRRSSCGAG